MKELIKKREFGIFILLLVLCGCTTLLNPKFLGTFNLQNNGQLIGLVTSETIGEMLMVRDALPKGTHLGPWSRPAGA